MPKKKTEADTNQPTLPFPSEDEEHLDLPTLENWLLDAANTIRGASDAPKFKDFILPLIFYKRLSDVFDDEFARQIEEFGDEESARVIVETDHEDALKSGRNPIVRFYIPQEYHWETLRNHPADGHLGEFVTEAMREVARLNPLLQGVLDVKDFNESQSGQRTLDEERLEALIEVLSRHRLGLLIKPRLLFEETHPDDKSQAPQIYGQELTPTTYAMAKMNAFLHDFIGADIQIGDTFRNPRFAENNSSLKQFDNVLANPMWNQKEYDDAFYESDNWHRFSYGIAPSSSADWGWVQHILASLEENGRAAIVLDTGAVSRGSGSNQTNRERDIRKKFVEEDLIEGVILLPENLFYNTSAPGIILLLNRSKPAKRKEQILLINLSQYFEKGKPKNILTDEAIDAATEVYQAWESREKLSNVITLEDAQKTDYNLSPSQFVDVGDKVEHRPMRDILADLAEARVAREKADKMLEDVLARLGLNEKH